MTRLLLLLHGSKSMLHTRNIGAEMWRLLVLITILRVYFARVVDIDTKMRLWPLISPVP